MSVMLHTWNPNNREAKARGLVVEGQSGLCKYQSPISNETETQQLHQWTLTDVALRRKYAGYTDIRPYSQPSRAEALKQPDSGHTALVALVLMYWGAYSLLACPSLCVKVGKCSQYLYPSNLGNRSRRIKIPRLAWAMYKER